MCIFVKTSNTYTPLQDINQHFELLQILKKLLRLMFTDMTRNEANISIKLYINKFFDITNESDINIEKNYEKYY